MDHESELNGVCTRAMRRGLFFIDTQNPFNLPDEEFRKKFRLPAHLAMEFIEKLKVLTNNNDERLNRCSRIPFYLRFLCALNYYATGSHHMQMGNDDIINIPNVSKCIEDISDIIVQHMDEFLMFPQTNKMDMVKSEFLTKFQFPNIVGLIGGTHIGINGLKRNEEFGYVNRHGFTSLNVQIICDANMKILSANARFPGMAGRTHIWNRSVIRTYLEDSYSDGERDYYLIGDSTYPLEPWLMTPITSPDTDDEKEYNNTHASVRDVFKKCIELLKSRFRCTINAKHLRYGGVNSAKIIYSCLTLHNFLINNGFSSDVDDHSVVEQEIEDWHFTSTLPRQETFEEGRRVREELILHLFP